ncbi:hypothetical protein PUW86_02265 [Metamycoplasma hyosynoviae]|uniref:hypothetical protein n=1 Tax=Metamycoplasma hyosynoviae TaxID=29559 RepID=UPI00236704B2|nr:hypothetical protein [Metamycoplasma hyosynoviae]MDD7837810.1 hypothetical protein [Metamycoplasma hyosynoviae]
MSDKTIELLIKKLRSIYKKQEFIIEGDFALHLQNYITRNPNNLDILFLNEHSDDLEEINNKWDKFISNFEVINKKIDNYTFKKYTIIFNEEKMVIQCSLSKNLNNEFIMNNDGLYLVSPEYSYSRKICELFHMLSNELFLDIEKFNNIIKDIQNIEKNENISLKEAINKVLDYEYKFIFYNSNLNCWNILKNKKEFIKKISKFSQLDKYESNSLFSYLNNLILNQVNINKINNIDFLIESKKKLYKKLSNLDSYSSPVIFNDKNDFLKTLVGFFKTKNILLNDEFTTYFNKNIVISKNNLFSFDLIKVYEWIFNYGILTKHNYVSEHNKKNKINSFIAIFYYWFTFVGYLLLNLIFGLIKGKINNTLLESWEKTTLIIVSILISIIIVASIVIYIFVIDYSRKKWLIMTYVLQIVFGLFFWIICITNIGSFLTTLLSIHYFVIVSTYTSLELLIYKNNIQKIS